MKASGLSFFSQIPAKISLNTSGEVVMCAGQDPVEATSFALDLKVCKMRFYSTPDLSLKKLEPILQSRIEADPLIDLNTVCYRIKKVQNGAEVHFFQKKDFEEVEKKFDAVVSGHQAFLRFIENYCHIQDSAIIVLRYNEDFFGFQYEGQRFIQYFASTDAAIFEKKVNDLARKTGYPLWGYRVGGLEFETKLQDLPEVNCPLSIGAALELLSHSGAFFLKNPTQSSRWSKRFFVKTRSLFYASCLFSLSLTLLFALLTKRALQEKELTVAQMQQLTQFVNPSIKAPPSMGKMFEELIVSIEPFNLDMIDWSYSVDVFEKKPIIKIKFTLEGTESDIEKYVQSMQKCPSSFLGKIQRNDPANKKVCSLEVKI